jgi:hypothetical protein
MNVTGANRNIATPIVLVDTSGSCVVPTIKEENMNIAKRLLGID